MVTCPKCGKEVESPRKIWKMAGRPDKTGKRTELTIGLFDCLSCNKPFRFVLNKRKIPEKLKPSPEKKPSNEPSLQTS